MNLRRTIAGLMPPTFVRFLGQLQFRVPASAPLLRWAARGVQQGTAVIAGGVGKGLLFDPCGSNPGYALGTSDIQEQRLLASSLGPGDVFYDIGANVRFFTTLAGRVVGPTGRVYGFEPFPDSAAHARQNASRNGLAHVEIIEAAVSDRSGEAFLVTDGSSVMFRLQRPDDGDKATVPVKVITLDELVAASRIRPPNYVVIDAEGAELEVLAGMRQTILTHRPALLVEVHWIEFTRFTETIDDLFGPNFFAVRALNDKPIPTAAERYHLVLVPRQTVDASPGRSRESS